MLKLLPPQRNLSNYFDNVIFAQWKNQQLTTGYISCSLHSFLIGLTFANKPAPPMPGSVKGVFFSWLVSKWSQCRRAFDPPSAIRGEHKEVWLRKMHLLFTWLIPFMFIVNMSLHHWVSRVISTNHQYSAMLSHLVKVKSKSKKSKSTKVEKCKKKTMRAITCCCLVWKLLFIINLYTF